MYCDVSAADGITYELTKSPWDIKVCCCSIIFAILKFEQFCSTELIIFWLITGSIFSLDPHSLMQGKNSIIFNAFESIILIFFKRFTSNHTVGLLNIGIKVRCYIEWSALIRNWLTYWWSPNLSANIKELYFMI